MQEEHISWNHQGPRTFLFDKGRNPRRPRLSKILSDRLLALSLRFRAFLFAAAVWLHAAFRQKGATLRIDAAILLALRNGDHDAFRHVYLHYVESIQNFLHIFTRNEEVSKELTQNIFITLWEKRERIDPDNNITGYLFTIARNTVFKYLDHLKVERRFQGEAAHGPNCTADQEEKILMDDLKLLIDVIVERMPVQRKKIFSMFYYDALSPDEICKKLNLKRSTVETHLSLARNDIKEFL